jgi:hypothetical protein
MKLGLVLPFLLRGTPRNIPYATTFKHYSQLPYLVHYCGSEQELSRNFAKSFGTYVEVKQGRMCVETAGNDILRRKFNDSLNTLPKDLDWYCLAGANDIISFDFFSHLEKIDPSGIKMAGIGMNQKLYCIDTQRNNKVTSWKLNYAIKLELLPGINCFSRDAMEACNWQPYQRKGCETGAELLMKELGQVIPLPGTVTMIKGKIDLNSMDAIKNRHTSLHLSDSEIEYLRRFV